MFESPDIIEKLKVSGLWFPDQVKPYSGLSGAAIFIFSNTETGETFSAAINAVALLPKDYWKSRGVPDFNEFDVGALVDKVRAEGIVEIRLSSETRAKIADCGTSVSKSGPREKCLKFGTAIVDIQDVDFDGKKEFVFRQAESSQRGVDAYEIIELPYDKYLQEKSRRKPMNAIDDLSEINISKRQLILHNSGGACSSANEVYSGNPEQGSVLTLTHVQQYVTDPQSSACYVEDYEVQEQPDGQGQTFKRVSRKLLK